MNARAGWFHYCVLILLSLACLMPVIILAMTAFKTERQVFDTSWSWIFMPTMDNFKAVIEDGHIDRYLKNSLIISIAATVVTLLFGTMCAYALARFRFLGRDALSYSTLILRTLPPAVLAVPVFVIWAAWGINDTLSGVGMKIHDHDVSNTWRSVLNAVIARMITGIRQASESRIRTQ